MVEYVELLPLDGIEQEPQKVVEKNEKTGLQYITYKTNNPDKFWALPDRRN